MAIVNGYATLAALKAYAGVDDDTNDDDDLMGRFVERASRVIDAHCRRWFYPSIQTRVFDAFGSHIIGPRLLLDADLLSVTTLTNGDGDVLEEGTDFVLLPANHSPKSAVLLRAGKYWTYSSGLWEQAISLAGPWGYTTALAGQAGFPADIEQACLRLAAMLYRQKETTAPIDQIAVSPEGVPLIPGGLPRDVREMLRPYVRY